MLVRASACTIVCQYVICELRTRTGFSLCFTQFICVSLCPCESRCVSPCVSIYASLIFSLCVFPLSFSLSLPLCRTSFHSDSLYLSLSLRVSPFSVVLRASPSLSHSSLSAYRFYDHQPMGSMLRQTTVFAGQEGRSVPKRSNSLSVSFC